VPEFLVTSVTPRGTWWPLLLVLLCAIMPSFNGVAVPENSNCSCIRSTYDPNSGIDAKTACEFVNYWATMAFEYETTDTFAKQQAASKWTSNACFNEVLNKTLWTRDFRTRPSQCKLLSIDNPCVLNNRTVAVDVRAVFSWASIGLKDVPVTLQLIVQKQSEGYRVEGIRIDYSKQSDCKGFLFLNGHVSLMYCARGKFFYVANNYAETVERLKPNLADKHSFDSVFFSWYERLNSLPRATAGSTL
jgi:hypothetical protein